MRSLFIATQGLLPFGVLGAAIDGLLDTAQAEDDAGGGGNSHAHRRVRQGAYLRKKKKRHDDDEAVLQAFIKAYLES